MALGNGSKSIDVLNLIADFSKLFRKHYRDYVCPKPSMLYGKACEFYDLCVGKNLNPKECLIWLFENKRPEGTIHSFGWFTYPSTFNSYIQHTKGKATTKKGKFVNKDTGVEVDMIFDPDDGKVLFEIPESGKVKDINDNLIEVVEL